MKDINNQLKSKSYFIPLFSLIILIDLLIYMLLPILKDNCAFLLIGIFNIILDVILWICVQHGLNWARWTFIISLFIKSGILLGSTLDDLFIINHFNIKYIILIFYVFIIFMLSFPKNIRKYYKLCSLYNYYLEQCKDYAKSRYDIPILFNKKFNANTFSEDFISISAQSVIDNCTFSIIVKNNIIYDNYYESYFSKKINSKIKFEINKYALKSEEPYANKLLNICAKIKSDIDYLEFNLDSSVNLFKEYKTKVPPYEIFYERISLKNNTFNFNYLMTLDNNDLELNANYIYLILQTLNNFNYKFDTINFYDYDKNEFFSNSKIYNDSNYIIKDMSYSKVCSILTSEDLSYIKEKLNSYMTNENHIQSNTYTEETL
ncbi:YbjO family protein [Clostridium weizhouense]|uniref:YbjO family protein n=1 Tax=Clostridium weizhouense TaxID=2859781 RepID=A0ABS7ARJ8_9CLOT|nr:YbjO family protein [Clostridium weizhouense]MBW6410683.1 YbjO family protein [Clostridium weizhouense]